MASRIKGITIEIDGDATGLEKALSGVNKVIRENQAALKDTERLLKLNPGSTELLTQKQNYLGNEIEATKEKLAKEKEALAQLQSAPNASATVEQQRALAREIEDTTQKLDALTKKYKEFGSVSAQQVAAVGEKMKDVGSKMTETGESLSRNVTAPIVAVGAASAVAWKEVDEGLDIITAKTGASGEALTDMQNRAKNLATSIPTDFATAGAAIGEVNTRFGLTGEELENLSGKFIKFASINETDVSSSIDTVQQMMAAFNLDASEAGNVLDILNKAGQDTGISVDTLASSIATNAESLKDMNFNLADSAMFLANMEKNGIDTSTAMTGLKTALKNATKDGKTMKEAVTEMQEAMTKAKDKTEAMQIATELFGSKAGPALGAACYEGRLSLDQLGNSMDEFAGNVDSTFEEMKDPMDDFTTTLNELKIVGADLVEAAAPMLKDLAAILKEVFSNLRQWREGLSPLAQQTIIKIAAIVAAVGPLLVIIGKLTTAIGSILTFAPKIVSGISSIVSFLGPAVTAIQGMLSGLFAFLMANPVIAIITAIIAIVVLLYNKCEWFRDGVNTIIQNVIDFFMNLGENIKNICTSISEWWNSLKEATALTWNELTMAVGQAWDSLVMWATEKFENIRATVSEKWENIKSATSTAWENVKTTVGTAAGNIFTTVSENFNNALSKAREVFQGIHDTINQKLESAKNIVKSALDAISNFFRNCKLELPHIKLPHFSISGSFSLDPPSVPSISVNWYRRAYENAYLLNGPTIFGAAGGKLLGGGEGPGSEMVVGTDLLRSMINDAFGSAQLAGSGDIIIPVSIGNERIDTLVVKAVDRVNYRSGGR